MKPESAARLAEAYTFLRRVEHRIQYLDDQQTHLLPTHDGDLDWIARSLGLDGEDAACALLDRLGELREFVATEFDALLHDGRSPVGGAKPAAGCRTCGPPPRPIDSEAFLEQLPPELAARVRTARRAAEDPDAARREQAAPGAAGDRAPRTRSARRVARWRRRCCSSTGSSRCCGARATWRCWSSGPRCRTGCCGCSAWRAGPCAT